MGSGLRAALQGWKPRLLQVRPALAVIAVFCVGAVATGAWAAAERNAEVVGVEDRALRQELERAIGDARTPVESRLEARRRARDAADNAEALLRSEGYYAAMVDADVGEGDHPTPMVRINLGPRFQFAGAKIVWSGPEPTVEAQAAAAKALSLPDGAAGRAAEVLAAEGRAVAAVEQYGYADAVAEPREVVVDHADHTVRPAFHIAAGPAVHLDGVRLETKSRTRADWVRYLAPWKAGQLYTPEVVAELERRLLDTQIYDQVTVALAPPDQTTAQGQRPVIVNLADRSARSLDVSAGYASIEGADVDVRWSLFDRFGRADTLALEGRYSQIGSRLGIDLTLPHWRTPGNTLKLTAEGFRDTTDAYDQTGEALRADLTHRYGRTSYLTRGLSLVKSRVNDKHTGALDLLALKGLLAFAVDRSSDPLNPTHGWRAEARLEPTGVTSDGGLVYARAQAQVSAYLPLDAGEDTVAAGRLKLGSIVGGRLAAVPAFDRFYAGGGGSVRGYGYQAVGPRYADGLPQGGLSLFEASAEMRHDFGLFGAVAFVDAGSVGASVNPDFKDVRFAVGLGLRYNLPFAPLRLDVARPLHRPQGDAPFQVYVSIGQSF
jgi:translocation and assembly module TamA